MSKKIAEFYNDDLSSWVHSIVFYLDEILNLEHRLEGIIRRNNIVDIAAKVEVHQLMLDKISGKLAELKSDVVKLQNDLNPDGIIISDDLINEPIQLKMKLLTYNFAQLEKEYIDVKYFCNSFLTEMLKK